MSEAVFEERRINVRRGAAQQYLHLSWEQSWPALADAGGRVLCLLGGMVGDPPTRLIQIVRYPDLASWEHAQRTPAQGRGDLIEREDVRLLRAISGRPKDPLPAADHRPVYGYRRFFIRPGDIEEFAHRSQDGVWPRFEAAGCAILGLWTTVADSDPREVVLCTGYTGPAHWEETRGAIPRPPDFDPDAWERAGQIGAGRGLLVLTSWVRLMRAVYLEGA